MGNYIDSCVEDLVGKTVNRIFMNDSRTEIMFDTDSGKFAFYTEGDCCSYSWIEHISGIANLIGEKINSVEVPDYIPPPTPEEEEGHECLAQYGVRLITSKGFFELEYRNSSNGYYGGWIDPIKDFSGGEELKEDF